MVPSNIDIVLVALISHRGKIMNILPAISMSFDIASEKVKASVAPTVYVSDVKVTSNTPAVAVTVNPPDEVSMATAPLVYDVRTIEPVVPM